MRLGIFGGSFDPVHYGHLQLAAACLEKCPLDRVWFVPAATSPHNRDQAQTPGTFRSEMLERAIGGDPRFAVCSLELDRGGVSYTIDTLAEIRRQQPNAELFLLLGADSLLDLPTWRRPQEICRLATPVVVGRSGSPVDSAASAHRQIEMPACDISSSEIRRRVASGESIEALTPPAVAEFIRQHRIYCSMGPRPV